MGDLSILQPDPSRCQCSGGAHGARSYLSAEPAHAPVAGGSSGSATTGLIPRQSPEAVIGIIYDRLEEWSEAITTGYRTDLNENGLVYWCCRAPYVLFENRPHYRSCLVTNLMAEIRAGYVEEIE